MAMKGFFMQCMVVLLETPLTDDDFDSLRVVLGGEPGARSEEEGTWFGQEPSFVVPLSLEPGRVVVDLVRQPWPDHMGDPHNDVDLFGAWSMGAFGPGTYPGGLARAVQQARLIDDAELGVQRHTAFLRLRPTYLAGEHEPVAPAGYEPVAELWELCQLLEIARRVPGALAIYAPTGEQLVSIGYFDDLRDSPEPDEFFLQPLIVNVRLWNIDETWSLLDTVGCASFDLPDVEVCVRSAEELGAVAGHVRSVVSYLMSAGDVIEHGNTVDGPDGQMWEVRRYESSVVDPPRAVLAIAPPDEDVPQAFLER